MIGLGSQYLTAAGFGRYRITAASLGNLVMFGAIWLKTATQRAILGAFGDDGWAVINATNAYLDGIAASDRDKATALADLINEDPMMVCSLGLQPQGVTMPWRWLQNDGYAYINSQILVANGIGVEVLFKDKERNGKAEGIIFGATPSSWGNQVGINSSYNNNKMYAYYNYDGPTNIPIVTEGKFKLYRGKLWYNDELRLEKTYNNFSYNLALYLFASNWNNSMNHCAYMKAAYFHVFNDDGELGHFIPMKLGKAWAAEDVSTGVAQAAGTCGMIDLVSGKFFPNANSQGSFTIPDISYTPSTP